MQNLVVIDQTTIGYNITTEEYHNPQYKGIVYRAFMKRLDSITINKVVNGYRRSRWSQEAFDANLTRSDVPIHNVIKDEHYWKAMDEMHKRFKPQNPLKVVHYADLRLYPWRLSTNVGAPYNVSETWRSIINYKYLFGIITDNRMSKHNLYNHFFTKNRYLYHRIKDGHTTDNFGTDLRYWNTAFARLHLVEEHEPDKVRLVFGAPTLLLQAEMAFIWPIQISLLNRGPHSSPMLWGYETIIGGWNRLNTWFQNHYPGLKTYFAFDWSQFDQRARHTVIDDIHKVWRSWFDFEAGYYPTTMYPESNPEPQRLENLWNWMCNAIKTTPLLLPNGTLIRFQHSGIFSGFLQTQILDSCYNMVVILTVLSRMGIDITTLALKVEGDDSIGGTNFYVHHATYPAFLQTFAMYAEEYFGSKLNEKKSEISSTLEGMTVLKYKNQSCYPVRPKEELLAMLYYPERSQSLPSLMARAIGIAYANCGVHADVYAICEDIFNHLNSIGVVPDFKGLPGAFQFDPQFTNSDDPEDETDFTPVPVKTDGTTPFGVPLHRFPTFFETMNQMLNDDRTLLTDRHWLSTFFLETPL